MWTTPNDWLTAALALLSVLALIGIAALLARAYGWAAVVPARPGRPGQFLALEEVLALDRERRIVLVRCGERRVLLLVGGRTDLMIGWPEDMP